MSLAGPRASLWLEVPPAEKKETNPRSHLCLWTHTKVADTLNGVPGSEVHHVYVDFCPQVAGRGRMERPFRPCRERGYADPDSHDPPVRPGGDLRGREGHPR